MTSILPVRLLLAAVAGLYIVLIAIVSAPLAHAQGRGGSALIARALTLYNIVSFVHWPEELFRASEGDLVVSIIGDDDDAADLAAALSQKTVDGHPIYVRFVHRPEDARGGHILFISGDQEKDIQLILDACERLDVLTVADVDGFALKGGMINFADDHGKVRVDVNLKRVQRSSFRLSSKLLSLSNVIK